MDGQQRFISLVMAGGKGSRLFPLTLDRAKPAVPFGGRYRIIDFVLSNLANSGIRSVYVLTQYKSQSLAEHVQRTWGSRSALDDFVTVVPAQMRMGESWYRGTADSVFQNLHLIEEYRADAVLVFGADHIYKMNIRQMTDFHFQKGAIATVACLPIKKAEASPVRHRRGRRGRAHHRLPGKARARSGHHPGRSRALPGVDGQLRVRARAADRGAARRLRARVAPRLRAQHPARDAEEPARVRLQLRPQPHPRRLRRGRERLLARRRHASTRTSRPTWTSRTSSPA